MEGSKRKEGAAGMESKDRELGWNGRELESAEENCYWVWARRGV